MLSEDDGEVSTSALPAISEDQKANRIAEPKPSPGQARTKMSRNSGTSRETISLVMPDEDLKMEQLNPEKEQPPTNDSKVPEKSSANTKEPTVVPALHESVSRAPEAAELQKEKRPEIGQPAANTRVPGKEASASKSRDPEGTEPSLQAKENESKEVQPATSEKEPKLVHPLTRMPLKEAPLTKKGSSHPNGKEQQAKSNDRVEVNPATREKAARKQDALPPHKNTGSEPALPRLALLEAAQPPKNIKEPCDQNCRCSVEPGAWSRHAARKLGMTRLPTRRMPRFDTATTSCFVFLEKDLSEIPSFWGANVSALSWHVVFLLPVNRPFTRTPPQ
ncbi:hypothetical protein CEK25_009509 [Fusarium fujikuroi]|nr:hypothetical protein CEK25_009509 [Fusarium fujikuroi]